MNTIILFALCLPICLSQYKPTWESLDSRKLPSWYDNAKVGLMMHWGVYSVPSWGDPKVSQASGEWFWDLLEANQAKYKQFMAANYRPGFQYQDFATSFGAELFDADAWADLIERSGARYYVVTSKHHEGFCNWPSAESWNWNSASVGPNRDLLGELSAALRKRNKVKFGLYYSLYEWFHPLFLKDQANNFSTSHYVDDVMWPQLIDVVTKYKPELIWSDGDWSAASEYWRSQDFLAWLYNDSPVNSSVVVNDRWGQASLCKHGGYYTCSDRYRPNTVQKHKWENAMTLDKYSWGYRRNSALYELFSTEELIREIIQTVAYGGNILVNMGPSHDGTIDKYFQRLLLDMGAWLGVNGEGIYGSSPWKRQNDSHVPNVFYTTNTSTQAVYVFISETTLGTGSVKLTGPFVATAGARIQLLGGGNIAYTMDQSRNIVLNFSLNGCVKWYGTLRMEGISMLEGRSPLTV